MTQRTMLPNASATLILGILSIVTCICYGIFGVLLGGLALLISNSSVKMYRENPEAYDGWQNLNAGRICAIIGLSLGLLYILVLVVFGATMWPQIMEEMQRQQDQGY